MHVLHFDQNKNISERFYTADRKTNTPKCVAAVIRKIKQKVFNLPLTYFTGKTRSQTFELRKVFEELLAAFILFVLHFAEKKQTHIIR